MEHSINDQEAFTAAYQHLLKQNQKSKPSPDSVQCQYRGPNGLMCAVGALFPDKLYQPEMDSEGYTAPQLLREFPKIARHFAGVDGDLLYALQQVHDTHPVEAWVNELANVAQRFNLTI